MGEEIRMEYRGKEGQRVGGGRRKEDGYKGEKRMDACAHGWLGGQGD